MKRRQTVVVMEGPDGCGKTNIGKALAAELRIPYFKVTTERRNWGEGRFVDALRHDQTYIAEFLQQTGHDCLIDRAWPSEYVYSQAFGRPTDMKLLKEVDELFSSFGTEIVLCFREDYSVVSDDLVPTDMLRDIAELYDEFAKWTTCKVTSITVDRPSWKRLDGDELLERQVNAILRMSEVHPILKTNEL